MRHRGNSASQSVPSCFIFRDNSFTKTRGKCD